MLIPVTISFLISTIFLNFGLSLGGQFLSSENVNSVKAGLVLGMSEYQAASQIMALEANNFNQAMAGVIEEAKSLQLPPLPQLPQFGIPMQKLPLSPSKEPVVETVNFDLAAENGAILDCQSDNLFFSKRPDQPWPIASITKLFTVYTFWITIRAGRLFTKLKPGISVKAGKFICLPATK
ncbi:MAG: hypothetical protein V1801_00410 [Candidatus Falkowbacteria bacterium]